MRIYRRAGKYVQKKLFLKKCTLFSSPLTSRDPGAHTRVKHVYLGNNVRELVFVNFHRQLKKGQYFKINSTKLRNWQKYCSYRFSVNEILKMKVAERNFVTKSYFS